jgi:hypothetical protein
VVVIQCEDDDELSYLLRKLERSRVKWLRQFAKGLLSDFFEKSSGGGFVPSRQTNKHEENELKEVE